jgi:hypothetical protein
MNFQNWKIFDKQGNNLNWYSIEFLPLKFNSLIGTNADGYLITDTSTHIVDSIITNKGWGYDNNTTVFYSNLTTSPDFISLSSSEVSIFYEPVQIFNPDASTSQGISYLNTNISGDFLYPSTKYSGTIFMKPISQGLVETETLYIIEESLGQLIRPYDASNYTIVLRMDGDDNEIAFFEVDEYEDEISWSDSIVIDDLNTLVSNDPLIINIGFRADNEGVFERRLKMYHKVGDIEYLFAEIIINAESIGQDERFRTLLTNFGLPDPINFPSLFKEANIKEGLPDWKLINNKSKLMILEHANIIPFIGTYKGLINAIKWLGYEDIYVKEWYNNLKTGKKDALYISYDAKDRSKTLLMIPLENRKYLKKTNALSLCYCITKETGELDDWGTPLTENCYTYSINEILIKLMALKDWLERYIIGVNCRIVDISGEGVYFERFRNLIYATNNIGNLVNYEIPLSANTIYDKTELLNGEASIYSTIKELTNITANDLFYHRAIDFIDYVWDPSNGVRTADPSFLEDPSVIRVGGTARFPIPFLQEIQWKHSLNKPNAVIPIELVSNQLLVYDNDLRFNNILDVSSLFYDTSTNLIILLENATLRDPNNDVWIDSIDFSIYIDPSYNGAYWLESSLGVKKEFSGYVMLRRDTNFKLEYAYDDNYKVPLLSIQNFKYTDVSGNTIVVSKRYFLDIIDGKIVMNANNGQTYKLNFNYDTSLSEQMISLDVEYLSPRELLYLYDPSVYYFGGANDPSVLIVDNSIYKSTVYDIGNYNVELYAFDGYNNIYYSKDRDLFNVWIKYPTIYAYIDVSCNNTCSSTYMLMNDVSILISQNKYPLFDRIIPLQGLTIEINEFGNPFVVVPSLSYFVDLPELYTYNRFWNLTERCTSINSTYVTIDKDFEDFIVGDEVNLVKFNREHYYFVLQASTYITDVSNNKLTLDNILSDFILTDNKFEIYLQNITERGVENIINHNTTIEVDISSYTFRETQMIALLVRDLCTNYTWGSSYRILDISANGYTYTLDGPIPQIFIDASYRYDIKAKHAFTTFTDFQFDINVSTYEFNNNFYIKLNDTCSQELYFDNTFVTANIDFDHDKVIQQWYDVSDNLINVNFYKFKTPINVDISTLVILKSEFDPSSYLINQKNIWTIRYHDTQKKLMRVFNYAVPYIYDEQNVYDIYVDSYDRRGNLISQKQEGLIIVNDADVSTGSYNETGIFIIDPSLLVLTKINLKNNLVLD